MRMLGIARATLAVLALARLGTAAAAEPVKLRIQYGSAAGQYVPILPLVPREIYRHYGVSYVIEPYFMAGAGPALTALAAGELDLAGLGPQTMSSAVNVAKLDLRAIVQVVSSGVPGWGQDKFWTKNPAIHTAADLKGKIIAVNARNSAIDAAVHVVLGRLGMKDGVDYQIAEVRFAAVLPAIESGRVDAGILVQPFSLMAESKGMTPVFTTGDAFGPTETITWTGKADWIAKNRAVLVDFVEDHIRMRRWSLDPATRLEAVKLVAQVDKVPVESMADWLYTTKDNYHHPEALIDVARFQKNVDDLSKVGVAPGPVDASKYVDVSIAKEAAARLR